MKNEMPSSAEAGKVGAKAVRAAVDPEKSRRELGKVAEPEKLDVEQGKVAKKPEDFPSNQK